MILGFKALGVGIVPATGLTNLVGVQPGRMAAEARKSARLASSCPCPGQTRTLLGGGGDRRRTRIQRWCVGEDEYRPGRQARS